MNGNGVGRRPMMARLIFFIGFLVFPSVFARAADSEASSPSLPWLLVDKKTNSLKVMNLSNLSHTILKTYRTTLGLVPGDKEKEGDKKTPEGIYFFEEIRRPPSLAKKFGRMALTMTYPNSWDRLMKRTGSGIWLHATDEPQRLEKDFDSLGCVVVKDEEIEEIASSVRYRVSPIVVYEDFESQKELMSKERLGALEARVKDWATSWAAKDLDRYMDFYHSNFSNNGMNLKQWREYKGQLNRRYDKINVEINHLFVFAHPKYDVAIFNQIYESRFKSGSIAKRTKGVKILYMAKDGETPRILSEDFRNTEI